MHNMLSAYSSENISFPEFKDFMMNPKADVSQMSVELMTQLFSEIDSSKKGSINTQDIEKFFDSHAFREYNSLQLQQSLRIVSAGQELSPGEFVTLLRFRE